MSCYIHSALKYVQWYLTMIRLATNEGLWKIMVVTSKAPVDLRCTCAHYKKIPPPNFPVQKTNQKIHT